MKARRRRSPEVSRFQELLFKRFLAPKVRIRKKAAKSRKRCAFGRVAFSAARKFRPRVASEESTALAILPAPAPIPPVIQAAPRVFLDPPEALDTVFRITDLMKPGEAIQRSMEGFLLDQRSEHTRRAYGKDLKRFVKFLHLRNQNFGPEPLTRTVIIAYKEYLLTEGLEHTTVDRHLATLKSFFGWLKEDGLIPHNLAEGVKFLKPKRLSTTQGFSDEEVRKVLSVPDLHTRTGALHYAVLMVLFYCGLRRSELCALRTSHIAVEREQAVLRVRGKGNAERLIPLIDPVTRALFHYFRITGKAPGTDQPLFTPIRNNRTGRTDLPLDPSMIFYIVTRCAKQAGVVNRVSPHSCRATAISNARDHQVSDRAIQEFAGWASTEMITRYDKRKTAIENSAAKAIAYGREGEPSRPSATGSGSGKAQ